MREIFKKSIIISITALLSCGVKGSPKLPPSQIPEPVKDINLKQQGKSLVVYWIYNPLYEDKRKIKEKFLFNVEENDSLIYPKINKIKNIYWFKRKIKSFNKEYCYRIEVVTQKGEKAKSGYFCILPEKDYPPKVERITVKMEEGKILLIFNKVYNNLNIYKGNDKKLIPPIAYKKIRNSKFFIDKDVKYEEDYCYYVTQISKKIRNLESEPSEIKCIKYKDIFPPKPPVKPEVINLNKKRIIIWSDSPSKDVSGYILQKNGKPLFKKPKRTYYYIDTSPKKGDVYTIFSIDKRGNKSRPVYLKTE